MDKNQTYNKFMEMVDLLGAQKVLDEVSNYFSADDFEGFVRSVDNDLELNLFDSEEEDY